MPRTAKPARRRESASPVRPKPKKKAITQYNHQAAERINNPPVGLVTPETDRETTTAKTYEYDPHLDPQLVWAGKAEHTSFQVPIVSVHVHERIDPHHRRGSSQAQRRREPAVPAALAIQHPARKSAPARSHQFLQAQAQLVEPPDCGRQSARHELLTGKRGHGGTGANDLH